MNISLLHKTAFLLLLTSILWACKPETPVNPTDTSTIYLETTYTSDCSGESKEYITVEVTDRGEGTGTTYWTHDKTYILNGRVFVNPGQTLNIEAGTIIKGAPGSGENAAALIVARGAKIIAEGTVDMPIVFTSKADEIARDKSGELSCPGGNLSPDFRGLWGGLIILGRATINSTEPELAIEGIPTSETRGLYGGNDDNDHSGILKYVSIRHGGASIGADNEINGLTLGAVGNGTTIDYVEIIANKDDGVEFFGGAVNTKHLVVTYCGDDAFDADEGYHGTNQYWVAFQDEAGDHGGEHDGGPSDCLLCEPLTSFKVFNATFIGNNNNRAVRMRENCAASYANSIFINYAQGFELKDNETLAQYNNGSLNFTNNILWNIATPWDGQSTEVESQLIADGNTTDLNPEMNDQWVPTNPNLGTTTPATGIIEPTNFKGAFNPSSPNRWIDNWTLTATFK